MNCRFFLYIVLLGFSCSSLFGADYPSKNPKSPHWDLIAVDQSLRQSLSLEKPPCKLSFFQLDSYREEQKCNNVSLVKKHDENAWLLAYKSCTTNGPYLGKIVMPTESDDVAFVQDLAGIIAVTEYEKRFAHIGVLVERLNSKKTIYGKIEIAEVRKLMPKICVVSADSIFTENNGSSDEENALISSSELVGFCNVASSTESVLDHKSCSDADESDSDSVPIKNAEFSDDERDDERCVLSAKTKHLFGLFFCVLCMSTYLHLS